LTERPIGDPERVLEMKPVAMDEALTLQRQLCFALYSATHAVIRTYRAALAECGLTYPQYLVVLALMAQPSTTSGGLARVLKLDPGTLTPLLKRLTAAGLIVRERRSADERVVDIHLTERGWGLHDRLCQVKATVEESTAMDAAELERLRAILQVLTNTLFPSGTSQSA